MRILVTFAVEAEFGSWRKRRKFRADPQEDAPNVLFASAAWGNQIDVLLTGIGRSQVERSVVRSAVFQNRKPDLVISSGLAGALRGTLSPGDLVVPQKARTLRNDANADADHVLRDHAIRKGALPIETLITADHIVATAKEKEKLSFFGEAVDMESALIMSYFAAAGVPTVTVRAISDSADEDLPIDFDRCLTPQGTVKPMSLVNAIVRSPGNIPNLIRFGRQSHRAAQRLAEFLDEFVAALPVIQEKIPAV